MEEYEIRIINPYDEEIQEIEILRKKVFHLKQDSINRYEFHINHGIIIPFALYKDEELVAGCYIGDGFDKLYVYFLFVKEEYQHTGLRLGRTLLKYVLDHKELVEERLQTKFTEGALHPSNEKNRELYKRFGFINAKLGMMTMKI